MYFAACDEQITTLILEAAFETMANIAHAGCQVVSVSVSADNTAFIQIYMLIYDIPASDEYVQY